MAIKRTSTSEFKKSDGFINLTVVVKGKGGKEYSLKAPVWGLDKENPLHAKLLSNPEKAAGLIDIKSITINVAHSESDFDLDL